MYGSDEIVLMQTQPLYDLPDHPHDRIVLDVAEHIDDGLPVFFHAVCPFCASGAVDGDVGGPRAFHHLASLSFFSESILLPA